jgi:hypothetical protein
MQTTVDERLVQEASALRLRFACPDCAHFDSETGTCTNGYPNDEHASRDLAGRKVVVFCKSFELG